MTTSEPSLPHLRIADRSDTGRSRANNQDFAYAGPLPGADEWILLAVADGLGGHARGEWASQRTIELVKASLAPQLEGGDALAAFAVAVEHANATVNFEARQQGSPGAATTLVAVLYRETKWWWCNVGDSRLYLLADGAFRQVSQDHSWVGEQVRAGLLSPAAANHHPNKNVVTRTIGFEPVVTADTGGPLEIKPGEALVLCSDGLHGPVSDVEIGQAVEELDPDGAAEQLVELANSAGGPDNITVVIGKLFAPTLADAETKVVPPPSATSEKPRRWRSTRRRIGFALAGFIVLAGLATALVAVQR